MEWPPLEADSNPQPSGGKAPNIHLHHRAPRAKEQSLQRRVQTFMLGTLEPTALSTTERLSNGSVDNAFDKISQQSHIINEWLHRQILDLTS